MQSEHRDQIPVSDHNTECAVLDCPAKPTTKANDPRGHLRSICRYHYRRIISGRLHGWHPKLRRLRLATSR